MANGQLPGEPMILCEVRMGHPQQVMADITDLFNESADAVERLRDRIKQLADQIAGRFAAEEQSGRYEDALCQAPWLTARAQELQQQHVELVETLRGIQRLCESSNGPVGWWEHVQQDFADFSDLLRGHEAAEGNLLDELHTGPDWDRD